MKTNLDKSEILQPDLSGNPFFALAPSMERLRLWKKDWERKAVKAAEKKYIK